MIGQVFGKRTVIKQALKTEIVNKRRGTHYWCKCECGKESIVRADLLKSGRYKECKECFEKRREQFGYKHNKWKTSTYQIWRGIKKRCNLPSHPSYKHYGGRGITYDKKWEKFINFLNDMGERPEGKQIDRINNDGNYEKINCRWVTAKVNAKNKRPIKPRVKKRLCCGKILKNDAKQCWQCYINSRRSV